jgi:hypothetical protein
MSGLTLVTDLHGLAPIIRRYLAELLEPLLGGIELDYDFYREWNGSWRVRVLFEGRVSGDLDFALLHTPAGGILALPRPFPESWRYSRGVTASDGSVWTLTEDDRLVPFPPPAL